MSEESSTFERYFALGLGVPVVLIAITMFGWGVRLAVAGLTSGSGWPPGLERLLLPIGVTAAATGFGGWRLLLSGVPPRVAGYSLGRMILVGFGVAALLGAVFQG